MLEQAPLSGSVCLVSYSALLTNFTLSLLYPGINQWPALSLHPSSEASEPQSFGLMKFALLLAAISDTPATVQHQAGKTEAITPINNN